MNAAQGPRPHEEVLRAAIHRFTVSNGSDVSQLVEATAALPLAHVANWERIVHRDLGLERRWDSQRNGWAPMRRFLSWIDLANPDGYVRERALRTLAGPTPNGFFFTLAARRLNDWVPQVRQAARDRVPLLAQASQPAHVVDALSATLPTWTSWGRAKDDDKQFILDLASSPAVTDALVHRLISAPAGPMPAVLAQALRTPTLDAHLPAIATTATQPAVRAVAWRALLTGKAAWVEAYRWHWKGVYQHSMEAVRGERPLQAVPPFLPSLQRSAADAAVLVRRVATDVLVRQMDHLGDEALPLARSLAADSSESIAERARFVLERLGSTG